MHIDEAGNLVEFLTEIANENLELAPELATELLLRVNRDDSLINRAEGALGLLRSLAFEPVQEDADLVLAELAKEIDGTLSHDNNIPIQLGKFELEDVVYKDEQAKREVSIRDLLEPERAQRSRAYGVGRWANSIRG